MLFLLLQLVVATTTPEDSGSTLPAITKVMVSKFKLVIVGKSIKDVQNDVSKALCGAYHKGLGLSDKELCIKGMSLGGTAIKYDVTTLCGASSSLCKVCCLLVMCVESTAGCKAFAGARRLRMLADTSVLGSTISAPGPGSAVSFDAMLKGAVAVSTADLETALKNKGVKYSGFVVTQKPKAVDVSGTTPTPRSDSSGYGLLVCALLSLLWV